MTTPEALAAEGNGAALLEAIRLEAIFDKLQFVFKKRFIHGTHLPVAAVDDALDGLSVLKMVGFCNI